MKDKDLFDIPKEFRLISAAEVADILAVSPSHLCAMRDMPDEVRPYVGEWASLGESRIRRRCSAAKTCLSVRRRLIDARMRLPG